MDRSDCGAPRGSPRRKRLIALGLASALMAPADGDDKRPDPGPPADGMESIQDLIFLGDNRPIFLRLRMTLGTRPFRVAWMNSIKAMHSSLDRDNDGTVTGDEAGRDALSALVRVANAGATVMPRGDLDVHPRDGVVSIDELADALRTAFGPFRVQVGKAAGGKADALFERLDGDKDGELSPGELADAPSTLHKLDLDDDDLIDEIELEPYIRPVDDEPVRRGRASDPTVVELFPDDSSLRPARLLLARYDRGSGRAASVVDNRLTNGEFAIEPGAFARADADADDALDTEELRRFLTRASPDIELTVALSSDASGLATVSVADAGSKVLPPWAKVRPIGPGCVEIAADEVRLEIHVDDGAAALVASRRTFTTRFEDADSDHDGYVEKSEVTRNVDHPSPLAGLFDLIDRDGDGKLSSKELDQFVDRQAEAARDRLVLTTWDQGRAIFPILDLDRDRRLGIREIRGTLGLVSLWDRDGDARIAADEIPHRYRLSLGRGQFGAVGSPGRVRPVARDGPAASGPNWFRKMDRNRDGDVSAREFRGPKAQFDRLDRDHDGLIDAAEAAAATPEGMKPPAGK